MDWIILRCSPANTLPLAKTLARDGFEAWTPIEQKAKRVPRANVKRVVDYAMLPSYLFVSARHLLDMMQLANSPSRVHRSFSVFHHLNAIPMIADATLAPLRLLERKSTVKDETNRLKAGDAVRLADGGFAGMSGVIESAGTNYAMVRLTGFPMPLKVANFYLLQNAKDCEISNAA
jgi:transcription antitermination factor NusG